MRVIAPLSFNWNCVMLLSIYSLSTFDFILLFLLSYIIRIVFFKTSEANVFHSFCFHLIALSCSRTLSRTIGVRCTALTKLELSKAVISECSELNCKKS